MLERFIGIIFISTAIYFACSGQSTFEYTFQNPEFHEWPYNIVQDYDSNYVVTIFNNVSPSFVKIDNHGTFLNYYTIQPEENIIKDIKTIVVLNESEYLGFGYYEDDSGKYLWILRFDYRFNIFEEIKVEVLNGISPFINVIKNINDNYVVFTTVNTLYDKYESYVLLIELSQNLEIIQQKELVIANGLLALANDIFQLPDSRYLLSGGFNIYKSQKTYILNNSFEVEDFFSIPIGIDLIIDLFYTQSEELLISGSFAHSSQNKDIGVVILDKTFQLIDSTLLGTDFVDRPSFHNCIIKDTENEIFIGGTFDFDNWNEFTEHPSWFALSKLNNDLEMIWQKTYGGDARYRCLFLKS